MTAGAAYLSFDIYRKSAELYILLKGRIVLEEVDGLRNAVLPRIESGLEHVFVDLQHVDYVDSGGLGLLINLKMGSKLNGASIVVLDPNETVADILNIAKIDAILDVKSGDEAQEIRSRLGNRQAFMANENSISGLTSEGGFMMSVKSDGSLEENDQGQQKREAVEDYCRRAVEHMRQGDYENSVECYKQALEVDPQYLPALNNLAIVYEKQPGWHPLAIEKWEQVLQLSKQRNDHKHLDRAERHLADLRR